jgi:hypothetical protein
VEVSTLDENEMKTMVLAVEKRINDNTTLRMKYPDTPDRFMDSELDLYSNLKRLHALATAPELFPTFVRTKCVPSLLSLLAHENSDISMDVVDLLHELTDADGADQHDVRVLVRDSLFDLLIWSGAGRTLWCYCPWLAHGGGVFVRRTSLSRNCVVVPRRRYPPYRYPTSERSPTVPRAACKDARHPVPPPVLPDPPFGIFQASALLEHGAPLALVEHMKRLDESSEDEAAAIHATLAVFEALAEAEPAAAAKMARCAFWSCV